MKTWKQPTLLSRNSSSLNAAILILETNKQEGEEYLFYFYKTNEQSETFQNFKGVILASSGISSTVFYDDFRILSFSTNNSKYKSTAKTYLKNYLISVITPYNTPDNIVIFICDEFTKFCNLFFENFDDSKKFTNILNKYCEILFYFTLNYTLTPEKEDIIGTPISLLPIINLTFSYNENIPFFMVKTGINDSLRTSIIENMNSLNSDRSVLQETLTLMDPPFYLKGYVLMYRGFIIYNSLNNKEMSNGARLSMLHEMYMRSQSSPEVLSCEFLFDDDGKKIDEKGRKKTLNTLLAQREFVIIISLEILGKNNCTFDPFYHKRAEDLLVNLLKKNFNSIVSNELYKNSIRMVSADYVTGNMENNNRFANIDFDENEGNINIKELETVQSEKSKKELEMKKNNDNEDNSQLNPNLNLLNNKIQGYIDPETKVNIIHFSCYDDSECVINTTDLNITKKLYENIYRYIFNMYAKIQTNINKLKIRNKKIKISQLFSYNNIKCNDILRKDLSTKTKLTHQNYIQSLSQQNFNGKYIKITEYGAKLNNKLFIPIWICCKLYEHITIEDDINMDEFSNYKIIFVAYESNNPVEIDSFCQDLLMNELFI